MAAYFLTVNNLDGLVRKFILEMENTVVDVADNCIDRDLLKEIVTSILYEDDYSEELKMKIIYAKMNHLAKQTINEREE